MYFVTYAFPVRINLWGKFIQNSSYVIPQFSTLNFRKGKSPFVYVTDELTDNGRRAQFVLNN